MFATTNSESHPSEIRKSHPTEITLPLSPPAPSSCTISMQRCLELSSLTVECLAMKRQIEEVRNKRKRNQLLFNEIKEDCEYRMAYATDYLHRLCGRILPEYTNAVRTQCYDYVPSPYTLRKHTELYRAMRHEEFLQMYMLIVEQDNNAMIEYLEKTKHNLFVGLCAQEDRLEATKEELVELITDQVASLYESYPRMGVQMESPYEQCEKQSSDLYFARRITKSTPTQRPSWLKNVVASSAA